jgi:very-short-patch-repair endonuclease
MDKKYTYQNTHNLKGVRVSLRQNAVTAEKILWKYLRNNQLGYKFRRQSSVGNLVADFCCVRLKLIVELDGWTHEFEKTQTKDVVKKKFLESRGYKVIWFLNEQIYGDIELVLNKIKSVCDEVARIPPPSPSP